MDASFVSVPCAVAAGWLARELFAACKIETPCTGSCYFTRNLGAHIGNCDFTGPGGRSVSVDQVQRATNESCRQRQGYQRAGQPAIYN